MRKPIIIGDKAFKFKKDAILHYRKILNSYKFGQSVSEKDFNDLLDLLEYDFSFYDDENQGINESVKIEENEKSQFKFDFQNQKEEDVIIIDIKVTKFQFNSKCFTVIFSDYSSEIISYLMIINRPKYNPDTLFNIACRNAIKKDIFNVKQKFFDDHSSKGLVKCQETNQLSKWEDLVVDHRQPNTFSVIVDRFKEVNKINTNEIEYILTDENLLVFKKDELNKDFRNYHKEKANLRIVKKECNSSRTGMARLKRSTKDLTVK
ncbi:DUF3223 domain-containing protein [Rufibacter sp. XAAS-G3-1]|uniref:DUF3223 domain-containing protein n=1 Tax=Rufibacter sp. XAAS-G3-1 TaxID=2729134 RepID=UPI0015E63BF2|nr:DUF3223 domain-containing protein [Rufibacter sp. XAAS-G3-1]